MIDFALPDVGEGLTEAEIVTWHVAVGDTVEVNTPLVDIETAKSVVEIPSPSAGTIQTLHAREGETLAVGSTLLVVLVVLTALQFRVSRRWTFYE